MTTIRLSPSSEPLHQLRADVLHPVFSASSAAAATTLLDGLLVAVRPLPRLEFIADGAQLRWELNTAESALVARVLLRARGRR